MRNILLSMGLGGLLCSTAFSQTGIEVSQMQNCDNLVETFMTTYGIPGATFALAKNGKLIYMRGFGYQDVAQTDSVQPHHLFRIASISKPITAIAVMKLIEDAKLSLTDTVFGQGGILENHPYLATAVITDSRIYNITVQNLLEHAGGWDRDQPCITGNATPYTYSPTHCDPIGFPRHVTHSLGEPDPVTEEMHIKFLLEKGLDFSPGTDYAYSNIGYLVLGEVIEEVSGMGYEDYVKSEILDPIGVCDMHIGKSLLSQKMEREAGYTGNGYTSLSAFGGSQSVPWEYGGWVLEAMSAHGGWITTARDLVRLILAVDGFGTKQDILNSATIATMTTASSQNQYYAKGWSVNSFGNWWHTGSLDGTASIAVRSSGGYVWAVILNKRSFNSNFWSDFDNLPWNCISGAGTLPSHDLLATPSASPGSFAFSPQGNGDFDLSWTSGDGDKRLVVISEDPASTGFPLDGKDYTGSSAYGNGDDLGGGAFVVYNGTQNSVMVQGLSASKKYYVRIIEYNQNTATGQYALYNLCGRADGEIAPPVTALDEFDLLASLSPNPVSDHLNIGFGGPVSGELEIINNAGTVVHSQQFFKKNELKLNLSALPSGLYVCRLKSGSYYGTHKFLKF